MSGLIFAGMALGGIHIANAQNNVNPEIDNSRYTVMIPSEVNIDKNTGKGSFAVTGKVKAQSTIDVSIQSKNGYKLKDKSGELPYNIDKKSFSIDNSRSASDIPLNEEFNIVSKTNTKVSGYYTDSLTFDITGKKYEYLLDVNGSLDRGGAGDGSLSGYGIFDVYVDGKLIKKDVDDFCTCIPYGSTWELKNIRGLDGYHYEESLKGPTKGIAGENIEWEGYSDKFTDKTTICRSSYTTLKFYTNKLKVNYYPNGAQKYNSSEQNYTSSNNDFSIDPNNAYMIKEYKYNADFPQYGLDDADRFKRTGYTCNNMYLVGSSTSPVKVNAGSNVYAKSQDLAEAANVLSDFKKNDVTINLYPDWTPIQSQLNLNANGGTFSDNSTFKTATDKLVYDSSSNANISTYTPTRKGYDFDGWYTDETDGTKIYNADGSAVNGTQYWQNNVYQNTEGSNVVVDIKNEIYPIVYYNGQSHSNITIANLGWSEDQTLASKIANNIYFTSNIPDNFDGGIYYMVFESYCRRTGVSLADLKNKRIRLTVKMKADKNVSFTNYPGLECTSSSRKNINISKEWNTYVFEGAPEDKWTDNGRHAFVLYGPSEKDFTLSIGDFNIQFDTDVELFAHWTKKNYSTGTVLNIEGSDYIVMSQTDDDTYLVIDGESLRNMQYQPNVDADGNYKVGTYETPNETRPDGQYSNTYEGSYIDNYLENTWYKQLPEKLQKAIQVMDIKQVAYNNTSSNPKWRWSGTDWYYNEGTTENPKWVIYNKANIPDDAQGAYPLNYWKYSEKGYNYATYNTISRHVFLPSVEEVSNLVDLNNANKVYNFLKGTNNSLYHMWFRDSNSSSPRSTVYLIYADRSMDSSTGYVTYDWVGVRPAFVINLSKIDYTVTGSVNYK